MNEKDSPAYDSRSVPRLSPALLLALLLAFALRVYRLDGQSLWSDEGASVVMAGRSLSQIVTQAAGDIHPPLYYILLHWWSLGVGTSEFALRYLSLIFGLLGVALVVALGRRLVGRRAATLAAVVAAFSPFLVYYAQEMRMYMLMATLSTLSVYLFDRVWLHPRGAGRKGWAALYVVVTAAALYTQYFAFTVVVLENLALLLLRPPFRRFWRHYLAWAMSQAAVGLLFLPWFLQVAGQLGSWPAVSEPFGLATLGRRVLLVFSFGLSWDATATPKSEAAVALLLLLGLVGGLWMAFRPSPPPSPRGRGHQATGGVVLVVLYLLVPVLVMYVLSRQRPMYNPKFLLLAAPAYYLLWGLGLAALGRIVQGLLLRWGYWSRAITASRWAVGGMVVAAGLVLLAYFDARSLWAYYHLPKYGRDDYRGLVRQVQVSAQDGDAILLNAPGQIEIFDYYYRGELTRYPLPRQRPLDPADTEAQLRRILGQHRRLWVVRWAVQESDPSGFVDGWLNRHAFRSDNQWYGSVQLVLYRLPGESGQAMQPVGATFGDRIRLLGYQLGEGAGDGGGEKEATARPGEILPLTLFWETAAPVDQRYTVFTHLLDPRAYIWGQRDGEPGGGTLPTSGWTPGATVIDRYGLPVLLGTPPGDYEVEVGLYQPSTGERLVAAAGDGAALGDRVVVGPVRVERPATPPSPAALDPQHPLAVRFGPLRLLGYDFHRLGAGREDLDFRPGGLALLTLYWQAEEPPGPGHQVTVRLLERQGRVALERKVDPAEGNYPTALWGQGEIVRDQHRLALPEPAGEYRLLLGLTSGDRPLAPTASDGRANVAGQLELQRFEVRP